MTSGANRGEVVWRFTNQRELNKSEFVNYFERKVFRTLRSFKMLPDDKVFIIRKSDDLNSFVIKEILGKKFRVKFGDDVNITSKNLSQVAEDIFKRIVDGDFCYPIPTTAPLLYLSDKEIELYAKLKNIGGEFRKCDEKIQKLFDRFLRKNPDLELNILKAQTQMSEMNVFC